jgi:hypothetical protein
VFIDVEGYEVEALRGAGRCIAANETDFFVETHVGHGLEASGGSVAEVLGHFPQSHFRLLISPPGDDLDTYEFTELGALPVPTERFFLVAIARGADS